MVELWKIKLEQRLSLMERLKSSDEQEKFMQEQRQSRKDWVRKNIYRGSSSAQPDKLGQATASKVKIAAE